MENFAFLVGTLSLILSVLTIVTLFLLRKNIIDILNKDSLIFTKNFEIKKSAIEKAMAILDEIELTKNRNISSSIYMNKIKNAYNDLICVVTDTKIADTFYNLATDLTKPLSSQNFIEFKIMCRKDLGFKVKTLNLSNQNTTPMNTIEQEIKEEVQPKPAHVQPRTAPTQVRPAPQARPTQSAARTAQSTQPRPTQPRPTQSAPQNPK